MKKQVTVYFEPVKLELEVDDKLDLREREEEMNRQIYDIQTEDIISKTEISYWE